MLFRSRRLCGVKRTRTCKGFRGKAVSTVPLPGGSIVFTLENVLQAAAIYCKITLISNGGKGMYDWNGNGQIDPMDQFIDYMVFQEVMGRGSNDEDDSEDDEDD